MPVLASSVLLVEVEFKRPAMKKDVTLCLTHQQSTLTLSQNTNSSSCICISRGVLDEGLTWFGLPDGAGWSVPVVVAGGPRQFGGH